MFSRLQIEGGAPPPGEIPEVSPELDANLVLPQNSHIFQAGSLVPAWHLALLSHLRVRGLSSGFGPVIFPPFFGGSPHPPLSIPFQNSGYFSIEPSLYRIPQTSPSSKEGRPLDGAEDLPVRTFPLDKPPRPPPPRGFSIAELLRVSPKHTVIDSSDGETSNAEFKPITSTSVDSSKVHRPTLQKLYCPDELQDLQEITEDPDPPSQSGVTLDQDSRLFTSEKADTAGEGDQRCSLHLEGRKRFDWLHCTRYRPPKLPRIRRRDSATRRKLGRNPRVPFTASQLASLESRFRQTQYLSSCDVAEISGLLSLTETRVKIWFQNRRARERRDREAKTKSSSPSEEKGPQLRASSSSAFSPVESKAYCHKNEICSRPPFPRRLGLTNQGFSSDASPIRRPTGSYFLYEWRSQRSNSSTSEATPQPSTDRKSEEPPASSSETHESDSPNLAKKDIALTSAVDEAISSSCDTI